MNKSYYAIIPAAVRYHPDLSNGAKLLYGEITALCNEKGYCWASNAYFAELYQVKPNTISRWIGELVDAKAVTATIDQEAGNARRLRINEVPTLSPKMVRPITKNGETLSPKMVRPLTKNGEHNNTVNNTVNILTGRNGIPRSRTPLNPSSDLELNTWLDAVAAAIGAKGRAGLSKPRKWELVCMTAIREQRDLGRLLKIVEAEKLRTKGQEEFFSPDTCLQKLQMSGNGTKQSKWTHEV